MFAHTTRIASVSALSLALIASSFSVSYALPISTAAPVPQHQATALTVDAMDADQKPAPVQGEDTQDISVDGIDEEALPDSEKEPTEEPSPEISQESEPSVTSEAAPQAEDGGESEQPESLGTDAQTNEASDAPDAVETPGPETVDSSPENASPTEATQNQKSAEEQQLAETAIEDSEGTLAALTTPMESIDFIAAGITWDSNTSEDITEAALRVREQGEWSEWHDLEVHATDQEMKAQSPRAGTEPLITLEADAVQARVHTRSGEAPDGLEVSLIDPGVSATDGQLEPASVESDQVEPISKASPTSSTRPIEGATPESGQPAGNQRMRTVSAQAPLQTTRSNSSADVIKPAIVTRAQWGANESITSTSPQSRELKAMYVHHTAGVNNYTRSNAYAQVRAIHRYHAGTLGWPDIGYHFLIDRYGTIYEGRRGSIDSLPLGAQAGGFNTNTIGISAIGNFDVASAPTGMVESMKKVLAWKGLQHGINATGTTKLTSGGGSSSKYSKGTSVTVNTILGHRDTNATVCPGRYLYSQLPSIRRDVATRISNARATIPDDADSTTTRVKRTNTSNVPVMTGRGVSDAQIDTLNNAGYGVNVVSEYRSWTQIRNSKGPGGNAWVASIYLNPFYEDERNAAGTAQVNFLSRTNQAKVPVFDGTGSSAQEIGMMHNEGYRVRVVGMRGTTASWSQIKWNGSTGWVHSDRLERP